MEGKDLRRSNDEMTSHHGGIVEAATDSKTKTMEKKEESNCTSNKNCNEGTLNAGNFKLKQNEERKEGEKHTHTLVN